MHLHWWAELMRNSVAPSATRTVGGLLILSWVLYLLCFFPLRGETVSPVLVLMIVCAIAGIAAGVLAMRNIRHWRLLFGTATFALLILYALLWIRAAMMLGDAMPTDGIWSLLTKVFRTKIGMVEHLFNAQSPLVAFQQANWEVMVVLQLILWLVILATFSGQKGRPATGGSAA